MDKEAPFNNNRATTEFIALTAHDLQSIINGIYGLNRLLADKLNGFSDPEIHELTELIASQCELGRELTFGLVQSYQQKILILNKLLSELQRLHQYRADRKEIILSLSLPDKELYVRTERTKLIRVLDNLLDNAVKFTPRKGNITISLTEQDNKAFISVSDTGIGIPNNFRSMLFDKQPQIQRQGTENEPSSGLGLYISRQLTDELQGELWFDSTENKGATFHLSLDRYDHR